MIECSLTFQSFSPTALRQAKESFFQLHSFFDNHLGDSHLSPFSKVSQGFLCLPKKRKLYTVLRSPHIDKKARDQFELVAYTSKFFYLFPTRDHFSLFCLLLKNIELPGVEVTLFISTTTYYLKD